MKQLLLLYRFNPYHNRRIVRYSTTNEYIGNPNNEAEHIAAGSYIFCEYPKNFAYRDGVDTVTKANLDNALETPDYCLVIDQTTQEIESRWFVMDSDLYSGKSTQLTLHRDMIADYYEEVLTAPCFIEKATLNPADPFIFNSENITVNRIKKGETLIKDKSKCAWVVGYLAPNTAATQIESEEAQDVYGVYADAAAFNASFPVKDYVGFGTNSEGLPTNPAQYNKVFTRYGVSFAVKRTNYIGLQGFNPYGVVAYHWNPGSSVVYDGVESYSSESQSPLKPAFNTTQLGLWQNIAQNAIKNSLNAKKTQFEQGCQTYFDIQSSPSIINNMDGQNVKIGNKYYKLSIETLSTTNYPTEHFPTGASNDIVNAIKNMSCWDSVDNYNSDDSIVVSCRAKSYYLAATEITSSKLKINLNGGERDCGKLPYKMFCIPYSTNGDITIRYGTE